MDEPNRVEADQHQEPAVSQPREGFAQIRAEQFGRIVETLRASIGEIPRLPEVEETIARLAVEGQDIHVIASQVRQSEAFVWRFLQDLSDSILGRRSGPGYLSGGLGSDTDPGVTGGYGDTGFGAIGNEPPLAVTEGGSFLERSFEEEAEEAGEPAEGEAER